MSYTGFWEPLVSQHIIYIYLHDINNIKKHDTILLNHWISEIIIKTTFNNILKECTYKVRNEIETKRNEINENETKRNQQKRKSVTTGRTNERTDSRSPIYPNLFLADVYKSYQKLTLEIVKKTYISCKSTFFLFDTFSFKKKKI